jgi:hypothetical protein
VYDKSFYCEEIDASQCGSQEACYSIREAAGWHRDWVGLDCTESQRATDWNFHCDNDRTNRVDLMRTKWENNKCWVRGRCDVPKTQYVKAYNNWTIDPWFGTGGETAALVTKERCEA